MGQVIQDFVAHLSGIAEVNTFAGTNIFPLLAAPGIDKFIVYTPRGGVRESRYIGSFATADLRIQLDIYSKSFAEIQVVKDAIIQTFNGFSGSLNTNSIIYRAIVDDVNVGLNGLDEDYQRGSMEIILTF